MDRNVNIIAGLNGEKIVLINDIRFKGRKRGDWRDVVNYLKEYVGEFYQIAEASEKRFICSSYPDGFDGSENGIAIKEAAASAEPVVSVRSAANVQPASNSWPIAGIQADAGQEMTELIEMAVSGEGPEDAIKMPEEDVTCGWYRYNAKFALPVYDEGGEVCRYDIFFVRMLVRHDADGKKFLYDLLAVKR